jgi:hypothetical protein
LTTTDYLNFGFYIPSGTWASYGRDQIYINLIYRT